MNFDKVEYLKLLREFGADEAVSEQPRNWTLGDTSDQPQGLEGLKKNASFANPPKKTGTNPNFVISQKELATVSESAHEALKRCDTLPDVQEKFFGFAKTFDETILKDFKLYEGSYDAKIVIVKEVDMREQKKLSKLDEEIKNNLLRAIFESINLRVDDTKSKSIAIVNFTQPSIGIVSSEEENASNIVTPFAIRCLQIINPLFIVTLGRSSEKIVTESNEKASRSKEVIPRIIKFPALEVVLRAPDRKRSIWQSLLSLQREIEEW